MLSRIVVRRVGLISQLHKHNAKVFKHNARLFHSTQRKHIINPLLPFDVLEELENDEAKVDKEKLKKQKKKLIHQKNTMKKKLGEEGSRSVEENSTSQTRSGSETSTSSLDPPEATASSDEAQGTIKHEFTAAYKLGMSADISENALLRGTSETAMSNQSEREKTSVGSNGNGGNGANGERGILNGNGDQDRQKKEESEFDEKEDPEGEEEETSRLRRAFDSFSRFIFKCLETIGITLSSVGVLGLSGLLYHKFYGTHVLDKMELAFEKGDPAYQLTIHNKTNKRSETADQVEEDLSSYWVTRPQQQLLDDIVSGKIRGRYYLVVGEKGTGKTTIIMEAMKKIDGNNVAIFDAHADPEIFRIRLGKALNYAYNEDYIGSLFSIRGPRDTTALLDIERAFNKLEELAIKNKLSGKRDKPLILIINNSHLIKENEEGVKLLELLQQKAESLGGSELVTMIFNSDDYWVYEKLKRLGTRLELINVRDFNRAETVNVLKFIRNKAYPAKRNPELALTEERCNQIYDLIGGRPQHIGQVARHRDTIKACHEIIDREKTWFLNQCGLLGEDMDDDVMEYGKFSTSAMLLMREFVEMDREVMNTLISPPKPELTGLCESHHLPELPLWRARQIMTRPDYIQEYDNLNIFTVDSDSRVRADSVPMMRAFHEIASQPNFDELLSETVDRVAAIESLGRTREIVSKDLTEGAIYDISTKDGRLSVQMKKKPDEEDDDKDIFLEEIGKSEHKQKWWNQRMGRFHESYLPGGNKPWGENSSSTK